MRKEIDWIAVAKKASPMQKMIIWLIVHPREDEPPYRSLGVSRSTYRREVERIAAMAV